MIKNPFVYIMASGKAGALNEEGALYIGVASNLLQRAWQHREGVVEGFSKKYNTKRLVYYEPYATMESEILREKDLKGWNRVWKIRMIEKMNPDWVDLYYKLNE